MSLRTLPARDLKKDYVWNTASSLASSLSSVLLLLAVTRLAGLEAAGVFSLAFAVGQQFQTLGMYEVRTFHVTDVSQKFSFGVYLATRVLTIIAMVIGVVLYGGLTSSTLAGAIVLVLVASLRIFDAFEDVFYSEYQRQGYLFIGGQASFLRIALTCVTFCVVLALTSSLFNAAWISFLSSLIAVPFLYLPRARGVFSASPDWDFRSVKGILVECLPLFLSSFLAMYIVNAPRFSIGHFLNEEMQGYFAILYIPAMVINMLSLMIFRPLLTTMAERWVAQDLVGFISVMRRGLAACVAASALVFAVSWLAGAPILGLVYGRDVSPFVPELLVLVVGGALNAVSVILYYAITTMRIQGAVFVGYLASTVGATLLCFILVPMAGLMGASLGFTGAMMILTTCFALVVLWQVRRPMLVSA